MALAAVAVAAAALIVAWFGLALEGAAWFAYAASVVAALVPVAYNRWALRQLELLRLRGDGHLELRLRGALNWSSVSCSSPFVHPYLVVVVVRPPRQRRWPPLALAVVLPRYAYSDALHRAVRVRLRRG
ncbi:hypothetical protein CKO15_09220 [Halorhodospira abdelmalekii]|nr:hypothetical protein [Halorhodospira abdelmalekii]